MKLSELIDQLQTIQRIANSDPDVVVKNDTQELFAPITSVVDERQAAAADRSNLVSVRIHAQFEVKWVIPEKKMSEV